MNNKEIFSFKNEKIKDDLKIIFHELNYFKKLPMCLISDDFCFYNAYLHSFYDESNSKENKKVRFYILNQDFLKYLLSFLLEIISNTEVYHIKNIRINDTPIFQFLKDDDLFLMRSFLKKLIENQNKNEQFIIEIDIYFVWTTSATHFSLCSLYFFEK